ncbi:MAG: PAS domain-containing protein [Fibrobacterota bacterium]
MDDHTAGIPLQNSVSAANLALWELDLPTGTVTADDTKAEILGYHPEDFRGAHYSRWTDLVHPEDYDKTMRAMEDHIKGKKEQYEIDYRIRRRNGSYAWFHDRGRIIQRNDDQSPLKIAGVVLDISARKQHEIALRENNKKFRLYFNAFKNSFEPMILTDREGRIIDANPSFESFYGYSIDAIKYKTPRILNPGIAAYRNEGISEYEYHRRFNEMWQAIKNPHLGNWKGEVLNQKHDGSLAWVELTINAVFNEKGEISYYMATPSDISRKTEQELQIRIDIMQTITDLAAMRDNETGAHIVRVGRYSRLIAEKMKMPHKFCRDIERFAPFHDVGKVGISDSILLAPRGLSDSEFATMKSHTELGYSILKDKSPMRMAAEIALYHHENYNGTGYPQGLKTVEIPLSARIAAIADVYDALRSKRPYKAPWKHEAALEEITSLIGKKFDPLIGSIFRTNNEQIRRIYDSLQD